MKRPITMFAGIAATAAMFLTPVQDLLAQKRLVVIEEFTSATCPPCVQADPVLANVVKMKNGVVSVRYHQNYPAAGDPLNLAFPDGRKPHDKYGVTGIPASRVNGHYSIDPRDEASLMAAARYDQTFAYPVVVKVTEDKSKLPGIAVKVEIESEMDLSNYVLQTVVVAEHISLPNLPKTLQYSNGQDEFEDAVLTMLPDVNGTTVEMSAGEKTSFDFSYQMRDSELWPANGTFVIAFLQNTVTGEIIQAGTSTTEDNGEIGSLAGTSFVSASSIPAFDIKKSGESMSSEVVINNYSTAPVTYTVGKTTRTPGDWNVEGNTGDFTIPAGGSQKVSLDFTKGATTGMGDITVSFRDIDGVTRGYGLLSVLSDDVESVQLTDEPAYSIGAGVTATGRTGYYEVPTAPVFARIDELKNLKYVIWNTGINGQISSTDQFKVMDLLESGVNMLFTGAAMTYGSTGADPAPALHSLLGFQYVRPIDQGRSTGGVIGMRGVAGDPITDGFSTTGQLINYLTPYLKVNDENAVAIMKHAGTDSTFAIRTETDKFRAVFFGFSPLVVTDVSARTTLLNNALTWIEGTVAPRPRLLSSVNLNEPVNFGKVAVGQSKEIAITLSAGSDVDLEINDFTDFSGNFGDYGITMTGLPSSFPETPVTLKKGESLTVKLVYTPTTVGAIEDARLSIGTNDPNNGFFLTEVRGEATPNTTSVGEVVSANGDLSIKAGPNPFVSTSRVEYTVGGTAAKSVRVSVYNELGQEVAVLANEMVAPGTHTAEFNGAALPAGLYHVVMASNGEKVTLPVVRVK
jgi:thiol-disulfide isomerase/thioredoxin